PDRCPLPRRRIDENDPGRAGTDPAARRAGMQPLPRPVVDRAHPRATLPGIWRGLLNLAHAKHLQRPPGKPSFAQSDANADSIRIKIIRIVPRTLINPQNTYATFPFNTAAGLLSARRREQGRQIKFEWSLARVPGRHLRDRFRNLAGDG